MSSREESDITQGPVFLLKASKEGDHYTLQKCQEISAPWFWKFRISNIEHCKKNKDMAQKPCSFEFMIQPEALILFFSRFFLIQNGKKNFGKCANTVSNVLPRMPVHLNSEFDPVCHLLCSQDIRIKAWGFFSASSFCNQQKVSKTYLASSRKQPW